MALPQATGIHEVPRVRPRAVLVDHTARTSLTGYSADGKTDTALVRRSISAPARSWTLSVRIHLRRSRGKPRYVSSKGRRLLKQIGRVSVLGSQQFDGAGVPGAHQFEVDLGEVNLNRAILLTLQAGHKPVPKCGLVRYSLCSTTRS